METPDSNLIAIEVKRSTQVSRHDFKSLAYFSDLVRDKFQTGYCPVLWKKHH